MLELLVRYARSEGLTAEPGFAPKNVRWAIVVDSNGKFLQVTELGAAGEKGNRGQVFPRCPELSQPEMKRGGAGCRHFLVDNAQVVTLLGDEGDPKNAAKHAYFVGLLRQASAEAMPQLALVVAFLADTSALGDVRAQLEAKKAKPTDNITFAIVDSQPLYPVESDRWHSWWRSFRTGLGGGSSSRAADSASSEGAMRCFATGELVEPALTHPKIAGLSDVGGLSMGDALVSFKQDSFRSYGLSQSENAAVSESAAAAYRAALNHLIAHRGQRLVKTKVVSWYKTTVASAEDPLPWLIDPHPDAAAEPANLRAKRLLRAIRDGERPDLAENHFYALSLSGAAGRVMVRDWIEGPFEELVEKTDLWFGHLAIVHRDGGLAPPPKLLAVAAALVRDLKELAATTEAMLWRVAVRGEPIPWQFLAQALNRVKLDVVTGESLRPTRFALLKAFHLRSEKGDPYMQPGLNEKHPHPAYQCGRLMAILANLQYDALGDVGAGVVQRYYAAASTTPALVFGRLLRLAQSHLAKARYAKFHEDDIAEVVGRVGDHLPSTLTLAEQSLFALGYYHQKAQTAADRAERVASKAAKTAEEAA